MSEFQLPTQGLFDRSICGSMFDENSEMTAKVANEFSSDMAPGRYRVKNRKRMERMMARTRGGAQSYVSSDYGDSES